MTTKLKAFSLLGDQQGLTRMSNPHRGGPARRPEPYRSARIMKCDVAAAISKYLHCGPGGQAGPY